MNFITSRQLITLTLSLSSYPPSFPAVYLKVNFRGTDNIKWGVALPGETGESIVVQLVVLRQKKKQKRKQDELQYMDRVVCVWNDVT